MNLLFSRNALVETGIHLPQTPKEADAQDWKHLQLCGSGPRYHLYQKGDAWLAIMEVGRRTCPVLIKDWPSLVNGLALLNQMIQGKTLDVSAACLEIMNDRETKDLTKKA